MGLEDCRFDVTRTETTLKLEARGRERRGVGRAVRFGSLAMLIVWPAAFAIFAPSGQGDAAIDGFLILGVLATIANLFHTIQRRLLETSAQGRVRSSLIVESSPADGDHRHAPVGPRLTIDGRKADADDRPRVALSTTVLAARASGSRNIVARYYVSVVLRRRLIRVETFKQLYPAFELAEKLAEALGHDAATIDPLAEVPVQASAPGIALIAGGTLAQLGSLLVGPLLAVSTDRIDSVNIALLVAGIVTIGIVVLLQEATFHFLAAAVSDSARRLHGIEPSDATPRRRAWIASAAWIAAMSSLGVLLYRDLAHPVVRDRFELGGERLALFDVDGAPEPIGFLQDASGKRLVALDARTGTPLWSRARGSDEEQIEMGPQPMLVGFSRTSSLVRLEPFDPRTGVPRWTADLGGAASPKEASQWVAKYPSAFLSAASIEGCLVVHTRRNGTGLFSAFDLATGKACPALAWLEGQDSLDPRRRWYEDPGNEGLHAPGESMAGTSSRVQWLAPLAAQEREHERAGRQTDREKSIRAILADGVRYELRGEGVRPKRLSLTASRDAIELWTTSVDAASIDGMPFAVGGGSVVVAGLDLRGHYRLRLVGIDTATGAIRYVRRHPSRETDVTDLALSGDIALVAWADELRGYQAATGELLWSTGAR